MTGSPVLYLLSGLPGSGKSTRAKELEAAGAIRISVDEMMIAAHGRLGVDYGAEDHLSLLGPIVEIAQAKIAEHLRDGRDVVLDHGLGRRAERDQFKALATSLGATWTLLCLDASLDVLRARSRIRSTQLDSVPISDETLTFLADTWERPDGEGETLIRTDKK